MIFLELSFYFFLTSDDNKLRQSAFHKGCFCLSAFLEQSYPFSTFLRHFLDLDDIIQIENSLFASCITLPRNFQV